MSGSRQTVKAARQRLGKDSARVYGWTVLNPRGHRYGIAGHR